MSPLTTLSMSLLLLGGLATPATPAALGVLAAPTAAVREVPDVFSDLSHDQALQRAREQGRLLLIDFTASWCSPCKKMDRTTWVDEQVVSWIEQHAVAIQVDVDEQPTVQRRYAVSAMPTIVVLHDGEEIDRVIGYRKRKALLRWLGGLLEGRTTLDTLQDIDPTDVQGRYELAQELLAKGRDDEASQHFLWLWNHALEHQPSFTGVRVSFMLSQLRTLVARHAPSREAFATLLDRAGQAIDESGADWAVFNDWIVLADLLGRQDEVIAWIERRIDEQGRLPDRSDQICDALAGVLVKHDRLAQAGRLYADIAAAAQRKADQGSTTLRMLRASDQVDEHMAASMADLYRTNLLTFYRVALAAERLQDAAAVEQAMITFQDTAATRLAIVRAALDAGAINPRHVRLTAEALAAASNEAERLLADGLLERVTEALDEGDG